MFAIGRHPQTHGRGTYHAQQNNAYRSWLIAELCKFDVSSQSHCVSTTLTVSAPMALIAYADLLGAMFFPSGSPFPSSLH
jgi:hypothetical protein